jgi:hypothetical protein
MLLLIGLVGYSIDENGDFSGVKGIGKDTAAEMLRSSFQSLGCRKVNVMAYAQELKEMVADLYGLDLAACEREDKNTVRVRDGTQGHVQEFSWRQLCEQFGTEFMKEKLDLPSIWTDRLLDRIARVQYTPLERLVSQVYHVSPGTTPCFKLLHDGMHRALLESSLPAPPRSPDPTVTVVIVSDVRFPAEFDALKNHGAVFLRVRRTLPGSRTTGHSSDALSEHFTVDYTIDNNRGLFELQEQVHQLAHDLHERTVERQ